MDDDSVKTIHSLNGAPEGASNRDGKRAQRSLRKDIHRFFSRYALVFFLIVTVVWLISFGMYFKSNIIDRGRHLCSIISKGVNFELSEYERWMERFPADITLSANPEKRRAVLYRELYAEINKRSLQATFYLLDPQGRCLLSNDGREENCFLTRSFYHSDFLRELLKSGEHGVQRMLVPPRTAQPEAVYLMGCRLDGPLRGKSLVFEFDRSSFANFISSGEDWNYVITDSLDHVLYATDPDMSDRFFHFRPAGSRYLLRDTVLINGKDYFCFREERGGLDTTVCLSVYPTDTIIRTSLKFLVGALLLMMIVVSIISNMIERRFDAAVSGLISALEAFPSRLDEDSGKLMPKYAEFDYIQMRLNELTDHMVDLMEQNEAIHEGRRIAEIESLQAQFHPHFLFNTLQTLKLMVRIDPQKADKMISLLASLLRYSIDHRQTLVSIEEDVAYVESYLAIQSIRYGDRLKRDIFVPEHLKSFKIPKLILQPLIENCITHGFKEGQPLHIVVSITQELGGIYIRVFDDGCGMSPAKLTEVRERLELAAHEKKGYGHIGLANTHRRLLMHFPGSSGLQIDSIEGVGTEICIMIPARIAGGGHDEVPADRLS